MLRHVSGFFLFFSLSSCYELTVNQGLSIGNMAKQMLPASQLDDGYYKEFDCGDVFSGLSLETDSHNIDSLRDLPGVINVWPLHSVPLATVKERRSVTPESRKSNYTMHRTTGVDKLHAKGIRGKGATIAIIDTGVNYKHKAVGENCFCELRQRLTHRSLVVVSVRVAKYEEATI